MVDSHQHDHAAPLAGLTVLDAGDFLAAPFCAMLLADAGADVLKVESLTGDTLRWIGEQVASPGISAMFVGANRGKCSVSLDLASAAGRELLRRLATTCDVVIHNRPARAAASLGLGYDELAADQPGIVVGSVTAFGDTGPYRERGGVDPIAQGMSGMAAVTGPAAGPPMRSGVTVVDFGAGMMLAYGVMTALFARARTGRGSAVTTSLLETAMTFSSALYPLSDALGGAPPPRHENRSHAMLADQFAASDGFVVIAVWDERRWQALCDVLGLAELAADPDLQTNMARLARYEQVRPALQSAIAQRTVADLVERLVALKIPCTPTYDASQVKDDRHVLETAALYTESRLGPAFHMVAGVLRAGGRRQMGEAPPPRLGEHTASVLADRLGLTEDEIEDLAAAGTIGRAPARTSPAPGRSDGRRGPASRLDSATPS